MSLSNPWPSWGSGGTKPSDGIDYAGGDNPKADHYDYLWDGLRSTYSTIISYFETDAFDADNSGAVTSGDAMVLYATELPTDETLYVTQCSLHDNGSAVPTGCGLAIAVIGGSGTLGSKTTLVSGDGTTVYDDVTGDAVGQYQNTSGGDQTVAVVVDNGHYNSGSGTTVEHVATTKGRTQ